MKTIVKIGLGIVFGFVLLAGGCAALVGGAMSASDNDDTTFAERKAEDRKAEASSTKTKAATTKSEKPEPQFTAGQENAIAKAEMYLDTQAFSRTGLIGQLEFEGFSTKDATFGVDQLKINWNEQAAAKAEQYLDTQPFSRDGLIGQLKFEGFSPEQAAYGVKQAGL
jgi:hypothetical protein